MKDGRLTESDIRSTSIMLRVFALFYFPALFAGILYGVYWVSGFFLNE